MNAFVKAIGLALFGVDLPMFYVVIAECIAADREYASSLFFLRAYFDLRH